jgi:flagellar motor switch protein FliN/FliY
LLTAFGDYCLTSDAHQHVGFIAVKAIDSVKVEVSVVLGRAVMPIHQLLKMGRGAVIELETLQNDPVMVYANNRRIAKGEIMIQGDGIAVSILDLVNSE